MKRATIVVGGVLLLALPIASQTAGLPTPTGHGLTPPSFKSGDVYMAAPVTGGDCSVNQRGIVRYDLRSGRVQRISKVVTGGEWIRYDPARDRLFTHASLGGGQGRLLQMAADGRVTWSGICPAADVAPTGTGIVYLQVGALWYMDANNVCNPVIDDRTGTTYVFQGGAGNDIVYSPGTNCLYRLSNSTCAPSVVGASVTRVMLSPDGTRVVGDTSPTLVTECGRIGYSLDRGPLGSLLVIDHGSPPSPQIPHMRILTVDPNTLDEALYAEYAFPPNPAYLLFFTEGAYSEALDGVVVAGGASTAMGYYEGLWFFSQGATQEVPLYVGPLDACEFRAVSDVEIIP